MMKYVSCILLLSFVLPFCKKDDKPKEPTKTEMLTSSSWKYDSGGVDQDRNGTVDISFTTSGLLQPCMLDNTGVFNTNGTGTADEGATKCNVNTPQTSAFNWSFASNETVINITGSNLFGLGGQFKVVELTSTKFTISKDTLVTIAPLPPTTVGLIVNLKH